MCVHYYNNHILAGFEDGSVVLFDCRNCKPVSELKVHSEPGMCVLHTKSLSTFVQLCILLSVARYMCGKTLCTTTVLLYSLI